MVLQQYESTILSAIDRAGKDLSLEDFKSLLETIGEHIELTTDNLPESE